jgi:Ca-activated chloride channel family protein
VRYYQDQQGKNQQAPAAAARTPTGPSHSGLANSRPGTLQPDNTPPPATEQSLALDQWLRGIPEDSAELLQRKFMIEHMLRQQGNEQ